MRSSPADHPRLIECRTERAASGLTLLRRSKPTRLSVTPCRVHPAAAPRSGGLGVTLAEAGDATFAESATRRVGRLLSMMVCAMSRSLRLLSWDILERLLNASSAS